MKPTILSFLLLAGPAFAYPPPPDSPFYIPPPPFIDVDDDVVLETVLKGIWRAQPGAPPLKFVITGEKSRHFRLRILTHPNCKELLIDRYALTIGIADQSSATDLRIKMAQIKFDGDRKKANCLGMPAWITFEFASPPNYETAKVTVREQFAQGPDENEYEMTHSR